MFSLIDSRQKKHKNVVSTVVKFSEVSNPDEFSIDKNQEEQLLQKGVVLLMSFLWIIELPELEDILTCGQTKMELKRPVLTTKQSSMYSQ